MKNAKQLKVVECRGTPYEIGQQWGEACRDSILQGLENSTMGMSLIYHASREEITSKAMRFLPLVQDFDPYQVEIMKGQARGAGVKFEEVFVQKCSFELSFYYNNITSMCTSFAATGNATESGQTLLGQTIDWFPGTPIDLLKIHHSDGLVQFVISLANSSEYAISSAGMGICANATVSQNYTFSIPLGCYMPKVMRQRNVQDGIAILKQVARGLGYYHLADANGQMMGIESVHDDYQVILPQNGLLLHSNHYITERFKKGDTASLIAPDSYYRLDRITALAHQYYGKINLQIAMEMLSDHDAYPKSICSHIDPQSQFPSQTLASYIMLPGEGAVYIAAGNPCEYEYVRYSL